VTARRRWITTSSARETVLNDDLRTADYGSVVFVENGLVLWNDDEGAYNVVVDDETVVDLVAPWGPRTSPGRPHCNEEADDEQCWTAGKVDLEGQRAFKSCSDNRNKKIASNAHVVVSPLLLIRAVPMCILISTISFKGKQ